MRLGPLLQSRPPGICFRHSHLSCGPTDRFITYWMSSVILPRRRRCVNALAARLSSRFTACPSRAGRRRRFRGRKSAGAPSASGCLNLCAQPQCHMISSRLCSRQARQTIYHCSLKPSPWETKALRVRSPREWQTDGATCALLRGASCPTYAEPLQSRRTPRPGRKDARKALASRLAGQDDRTAV